MSEKFEDANFYKYLEKAAKYDFFAQKRVEISITGVWFL
jgi:hypothetical protein